MNNFLKIFLTVFCIAGIASADLKAQQSSENELINELRKMVKSEAFNISSLIMARSTIDFDSDGTRRMTVPQARLKVTGKLDGGFSYNLHFDAADNSILLDAIIGYKISDGANFTVGAQKPGISYEFLTGPHKIDFVSRSQVVTALTQNRDIGAKLSGDLNDNFNYSVGIFNGNSLNSNDNNKFYYAGRLGFSSDEGTLVGGVNAAFGDKNGTSITGKVLPAIDGERVIYGGDLRFENSQVILATEVLGASLEYAGIPDKDNVFGFHVTGGYKFSEKVEMLARYEQFNSDVLSSVETERAVIGYTHYPTGQTAFRINYLLPLDDSAFENHGLALNYQISF
ncbi:porin [Gracilimonas mengyeensis]|uniref:Phosphate-selective porin O and P n=1 Tax=Gracilimonas mengyeensis TaxID=1302730 RepID=A0A521BJ96_9BACT|nr:porin [Gracilimonas mengyeensis]SMO47165.1 Phosphate-selective porin O and P [Gracilimonas mengyeensis]